MYQLKAIQNEGNAEEVIGLRSFILSTFKNWIDGFILVLGDDSQDVWIQ